MKLSERMVGQWLRRWLPFKIVTKGGWFGYSSIQDAVSACANSDKKLILVGPGTFSEVVTIAVNNLMMVGCGASTVIDGGTRGTAVYVTGADVVLAFMSATTTAGSGNSYQAWYLNGPRFLALRLAAVDSDEYGFRVESSGSGTMAFCIVYTSDASNVRLAGRVTMIGCHLITCAATYAVQGVSTGDHSIIVANFIEGGGTDGVNIAAGMDDCVAAANVTNTGVTDASGSGEITGSNNEY